MDNGAALKLEMSVLVRVRVRVRVSILLNTAATTIEEKQKEFLKISSS